MVALQLAKYAISIDENTIALDPGSPELFLRSCYFGQSQSLLYSNSCIPRFIGA